MAVSAGSCKRPTRGFTLIEIVVVTAIIAVLFSLAVTAVFGAIRRAKSAHCVSNLHQLGLALALYAGAHDEYLPSHPNYEVFLMQFEPGMGGGGMPTPSLQPKMLVEAVDPFLKNRDVWFCPEDPARGTPMFRRGIRHQYTSYMYWPIVPSWLARPDKWPMVVNTTEMTVETGIVWDPGGFGLSIPPLDPNDFSDHPNSMINVLRGDFGAGHLRVGVVTKPATPP